MTTIYHALSAKIMSAPDDELVANMNNALMGEKSQSGRELYFNLNLAKASLSNYGHLVVYSCRERCGAWGMFGRNLIPSCIDLVEGVSTAEGDYVPLALMLARFMVERWGYQPPMHTSHGTLDITRASDLVQMWRQREVQLLNDITQRVKDSKGAKSDVWGQCTSDCLRLVECASLRMACEVMLKQGKELMVQLVSWLHISETPGETVSMLNADILTPKHLKMIPELIEKYGEKLFQEMETIIDSWGEGVSAMVGLTPIGMDDLGTSSYDVFLNGPNGALKSKL